MNFKSLLTSIADTLILIPRGLRIEGVAESSSEERVGVEIRVANGVSVVEFAWDGGRKDEFRVRVVVTS